MQKIILYWKNHLLFSNKDFRYIFLSNFITKTGNMMFNLILIVNIYQNTQSARGVGSTFISIALPSLIIGPYAGHVIDKYNKKCIMYMSEFASFIVILLLTFSSNLFIINFLVFLNSSLRLFYSPALNSTLVYVVKKEDLSEANAHLSLSNNLISVLAPTLTGFLAAYFSFKSIFLINALSFLLSAFFIMLLPNIKNNKGEQKKILASMQDLVMYLKNQKLLQTIYVMILLLGICVAINNTLLVVFTMKTFNDIKIYGFFNTSLTFGFFIGSLLFTLIFKKEKYDKKVIMFAGMMMMGTFFSFFILFKHVVPIMIFRFFIGMGIYFFSVANSILIQHHVEKNYLGRVNSFKVVINNTAVFAIIPLVTWLSDRFSYHLLFLTAGGFAFIFSLCGLTWLFINNYRKKSSQSYNWIH